jgi:hypothetical protein
MGEGESDLDYGSATEIELSRVLFKRETVGFTASFHNWLN